MVTGATFTSRGIIDAVADALREPNSDQLGRLVSPPFLKEFQIITAFCPSLATSGGQGLPEKLVLAMR